MNFNVKHLINNYSHTYTITHKNEGYWDGPNWIEGQKVDYEIDAAIFNITAEEIEEYEGLNYTTQDIKILIPKPIIALNLNTQNKEQIEIKEDDSIQYLNDKYIFDDINDQSVHADYVRWVAVLDQEGGNQ